MSKTQFNKFNIENFCRKQESKPVEIVQNTGSSSSFLTYTIDYNATKNVKINEPPEAQQPKGFRRYFEPVKSFESLSKGVCRRCKEPGHYEKMCLQESGPQAQVCNFCLGNHFHLRCTNTLCYRCNRTGHMAKDCDRHDSNVRCHKCGKRGHMARTCGIMAEVYDMSNVDKSELKFMKCIVCVKRGHVNCSQEQKKQKKDPIYNGYYIEIALKKKKMKEEKYLKYTYDEEAPKKKKPQNKNSNLKHKAIKKVKVQNKKYRN